MVQHKQKAEEDFASPHQYKKRQKNERFDDEHFVIQCIRRYLVTQFEQMRSISRYTFLKCQVTKRSLKSNRFFSSYTTTNISQAIRFSNRI
jgi:hypothetical protein